MFKKFSTFFDLKQEFINNEISIYDNFMNCFSGIQCANGLFNIFRKEDINKWSGIVKNTYLECDTEVSVFGYDWLGRIFAIDKNEEKRILIFEIGTADILEVNCDFLEFLNEEIPLYNEACFATSFYIKWLCKKKIPVIYGRCIGYKVPLFVGGKDVIRNLEDSDLEVYWYILSELKERIE